MLAAAAAGMIGFTGFTLVMPFLPLYIAELGTTDVKEIAMWTGLTLGATPTVTAISAPLWGRVGDRYGSKVLVIRSLIAFILTKAAMAFVTAPWQLFALRALLGVFAGYGALTISMAAESAPRDRMAQAIGMVQTGHRLGPAVGPVIGGLLAPIVGLRNAFLFAAAFYVVALIAIVVFYQEPREANAPAQDARRPRGARSSVPIAGIPAGVGRDFRPADRRSQLRSGAAAVCRSGRRPGHPHSDRDRRLVLAWRDLGGVRPPPRRAFDESPSGANGHRRGRVAGRVPPSR